ncbi:hypothetical protein BS50DRAFT_660912 [Corynespora cassiicola Philippines]|uniref:Uncharacterized protein n=1 Tax=Corynespora cassiicola Philippines TaxID=1448308 RepID=A0A2T2N1E9_CORCC|nr:hypothetical protein BS50DRAFT_660912 [Corynespora cassiicola Philippines]
MLDAVEQELKTELKNTTDTVHAIVTSIQQNMGAGEEARIATKEAVENSGSQTGGAVSYAAMAARGATLAGTPNTQVPRMPPMQTQREVVVTIRDPSTVRSLRAMNQGNLNARNTTRIKVLSSNQLKDGDLSIKTATSNEVEALKTRDEILIDNKPFILRAKIKYIGRLTRNAHTKATSSIIIEFSNRDCLSKLGRTVPRKCAACWSEHGAWSFQCPTKKEERAKARVAHDTRLYYYPVTETGRTIPPEVSCTAVRRSRLTQAAAPMNRSHTG